MACVTALALPGCGGGGGGGGGGGNTNPGGGNGGNSTAGGDGGNAIGSGGANNGSGTVASFSWAEGDWQGPASNGDTDSLVILRNGEVWGTYGEIQSMTYYIKGMFHGSSNTSTNTNISGSFTRFDLTDFTPNANYNFSGTVLFDSSLSIAFNGTNLAARYDSDYFRQQSLSSSYSGTVANDYDAYGKLVQQTLNISDSTVTMPADEMGCSASGTIAPRDLAASVSSISLTFSGASCPLGDGTTVQGILFQKIVGIRVMAVTPDGQRGFLFLGK